MPVPPEVAGSGAVPPGARAVTAEGGETTSPAFPLMAVTVPAAGAVITVSSTSRRAIATAARASSTWARCAAMSCGVSLPAVASSFCAVTTCCCAFWTVTSPDARSVRSRSSAASSAVCAAMTAPSACWTAERSESRRLQAAPVRSSASSMSSSTSSSSGEEAARRVTRVVTTRAGAESDDVLPKVPPRDRRPCRGSLTRCAAGGATIAVGTVG